MHKLLVLCFLEYSVGVDLKSVFERFWLELFFRVTLNENLAYFNSVGEWELFFITPLWSFLFRTLVL